jgi:hypothetical protein
MLALTFRYECHCGSRNQVYMPKRKFYVDFLGEEKNWDESEATLAEERREAQRVARHAGFAFIDSTDTWFPACPRCGEDLDIRAAFMEARARKPPGEGQDR